MKAWLIEPRDTLVVRDGAPADSVMRSLAFPWPSSLAGLIRTRVGTGPDGFDAARVAELRELTIHGPLLASLDDEGELRHAWAPAPQDCVWHPARGSSGLERRALTPRPLPEGALTDLDDLELVAPAGGLRAIPSQKAARAPAFWRWEELEAWLADASRDAVDTFDAAARRERFRDELLREVRTHVAIAADTLTASHGQLFETHELRFTDGTARFGLWVRTDAAMQPGIGRLGGEGHISLVRQSSAPWPALPDAVRAALRGKQRARVVLLTPGVFRQGHRPDDQPLGARVVAAIVDRPLAQSGWDYATNRPKASRRLAPAGSVYWIETDDAERWAEERWMTSICDDAQDARNGFGLCVVGVE